MYTEYKCSEKTRGFLVTQYVYISVSSCPTTLQSNLCTNFTRGVKHRLRLAESFVFKPDSYTVIIKCMLSSSPYGFQSCWSTAVSRVQLVLLGWKHWLSLLTFVCLCVQWPSSVASSCWSCLCLSCSTTSPKRWVPPAPPIDTPTPPPPQGSIMEDGISTSSHSSP